MEANVNKTNTSLDKAFRILEYMSGCGVPKSVAELSKELNYNRVTTNSLLSTMLVHHYVVKDKNGRYQISSKLFELGTTFCNSNPIVHALVQHDFFSSHDYDCALGLTILSQPHKGVLLCVQNNMKYFEIVPMAGSAVPLHATGGGKILLAYSTEEYKKSFFSEATLQRYTENTITTEKELRNELEKVVKQGYALDKSEDRHNLWCISAPVFGPGRNILAAVSLTGQADYMKENEVRFINDILVVGTVLSVCMGGGDSFSRM